MRDATKKLIHFTLTHQWKDIDQVSYSELDLVGKHLLLFLYDHKLTRALDGLPLQTIQDDRLSMKQFYLKTVWYKKEETIVLMLILRIGFKPMDVLSGHTFSKYQSYVPNAIADVHLTQPKIKEYLLSIQDDKYKYPFLDLLKGMYYVWLKEHAKAKIHLKNMVDPQRKAIATYLQVKNAQQNHDIQAWKDALDLLKRLPSFPFPIQSFLDEQQADIDRLERIDFFNDITSISTQDKIREYIARIFDASLWKKVDQKTKAMVQNAFYLTSKMSRLLDEESGPIVDYSPFALPFVKAYEYECYKLFFKGYIHYLKKENISPVQSIPPHAFKKFYPSIVDHDAAPIAYQPTAPEKFAIGNISYIVDINHTLAKKALESVDPSLLTIAPYFEQYWNRITRKLDMVEKGRGKVIQLAANAYEISKLRNKMTHAEMLTFDEFKRIVDLILTSRHLIEIMHINLNAS
jgi:hypothetical protein